MMQLLTKLLRHVALLTEKRNKRMYEGAKTASYSSSTLLDRPPHKQNDKQNLKLPYIQGKSERSKRQNMSNQRWVLGRWTLGG